MAGVPTIVQYYAAGSSAYFVTGCRNADGTACTVSWHSNMWMRAGEGWGDAVALTKTDEPFVWETEVPISDGKEQLWLVPCTGCTDKYGTSMDGLVVAKLEESGRWPAGSTTSLATTAEWAQQIRIDACCTMQNLLGPNVFTFQRVWTSSAPCYQTTAVCKLTFNDLTMSMTVANAAAPPPPPSVVLPSTSADGVDVVKAWAAERVAHAAANFTGARMPSPESWEDLVVYEVMVDRFNNGDASNDRANVAPTQAARQDTSSAGGMAAYRHGGDLQGVIDRLDYLADLGVGVIYLTPIFKHTGTYHGYCTSDWTEVDPGFGTTELLAELVRNAHGKGMYVFLDISVNHMCGLTVRYTDTAPSKSACLNALSAYDLAGTAVPSGVQGTLDFGSGFFRPLDKQEFFSRCGTVDLYSASGHAQRIYGDFALGNSTDHTIAGDENAKFDFNTNDVDFMDIFADLIKYWVAAADIDGLRLDAVAHVTNAFTAHFSTTCATTPPASARTTSSSSARSSTRPTCSSRTSAR